MAERIRSPYQSDELSEAGCWRRMMNWLRCRLLEAQPSAVWGTASAGAPENSRDSVNFMCTLIKGMCLRGHDLRPAAGCRHHEKGWLERRCPCEKLLICLHMHWFTSFVTFIGVAIELGLVVIYQVLKSRWIWHGLAFFHTFQPFLQRYVKLLG